MIIPDEKTHTNLMKLFDVNSSITYFEPVTQHIKDDLELEWNSDTPTVKSLYDYVLYTTSEKTIPTLSEKRVYNSITNTFITSKELIQLNQSFIKIIGENCDAFLLEKQVQQNSIIENVFEEPLNSDFYDKYNYIEYESVKSVNHSTQLMGFVNVYTLSSPLLSLLMPLFILLTPFLIMKLRGINISFVNYFSMIQEILSRLPISRLFDFKNTSLSSKLSSLFGIFMYILQMYYNTKYCVSYVSKNREINTILVLVKKSLTTYMKVSSVLREVEKQKKNDEISFSLYNNYMDENDAFCKQLLSEMCDCNEDYSVFSLNHVNTIGNKLVLYYKLRTNYDGIQQKLKELFDIISLCYFYKNIHTNVENGILNFCDFKNENNYPIQFEKMYFPTLIDYNKDKPIKYNSLSLNKSLIISGPNASGKTTVLKSILFNTLCTQQFGIGFYKKCTVNSCFEKIDSYINISDTHDRNSLFQNEAMRMRSMLKTSNENKGPVLFVVDELFSGTNIIEASACGIASLRELLKNNTVVCLTTHYYTICDYFSQKKYSKKIVNMKMDCCVDETHTLSYNYKLKNGISKVCGGINVLREANYPPTIISYACDLINKL